MLKYSGIFICFGDNFFCSWYTFTTEWGEFSQMGVSALAYQESSHSSCVATASLRPLHLCIHFIPASTASLCPWYPFELSRVSLLLPMHSSAAGRDTRGCSSLCVYRACQHSMLQFTVCVQGLSTLEAAVHCVCTEPVNTRGCSSLCVYRACQHSRLQFTVCVQGLSTVEAALHCVCTGPVNTRGCSSLCVYRVWHEAASFIRVNAVEFVTMPCLDTAVHVAYLQSTVSVHSDYRAAHVSFSCPLSNYIVPLYSCLYCLCLQSTV